MDERKTTTGETMNVESVAGNGETIATDTEDVALLKHDIWEGNHSLIAEAMSVFMGEHERMPTKTELAKLTGLCRPTIYAHLKEYAVQPELKQTESGHRVLYSKLLARLFAFAMNGDVRAARLYIETVDRIEERGGEGEEV